MNWRFAFLVCTLVAAAALPSTLATEGVRIVWISEPVMNPDPVEAGSTAEVSFQFEVYNLEREYGCRDVVLTGMYDFPVCAYLLQWAVSLDGEWLTEGSTPLSTGFMPHGRSLEQEKTSTFVNVTDQVLMDVEPGEHQLHVQVNWVANVPISSWSGYLPEYHPYPCGLKDYVDVPVVRCNYRYSGWEFAPVTTVEVSPSARLDITS